MMWIHPAASEGREPPQANTSLRLVKFGVIAALSATPGLGQSQATCLTVDNFQTMIPKKSQNPSARLLLHGRQGGDFVIPEAQGPMPGPHELQIHWISQQSHYDASGKYSLEQSLICTREVLIEADQRLAIHLQLDDFSPLDIDSD